MEEILRKRKIDWLMHFTSIENLKSIIKNGLVPRNTLKAKNIDSITNDYYRYDNCEGANCMSVEFPNYKMFYTLRCDNPGSEWVVLALESKLLSDFRCAYCYTNAGSQEIYNSPIEGRMNINAFKSMFDERKDYPSREVLNIPEYYPTNPQAEVLVFGIIPIEYIKYIIFNNENTLNRYKSIIPKEIECVVDDNFYFYGRCDYEFWR